MSREMTPYYIGLFKNTDDISDAKHLHCGLISRITLVLMYSVLVIL